MSESVPSGWEVKQLGTNLNILSGFPFESKYFTQDRSYIGLIRIRDLLIQKFETYFANEFLDKYLVKKGDVLIGMDGDFNIVKWRGASGVLNQRICKVGASSNSGLNTDYIYYLLGIELNRIHSITPSTTVKHLSVNDIRNIELPLPPLPEQQKIASILTSVDTVIEKTEAQINKLKDLKKAMMQELLTKGIGHTEFKDSPIGKIPKGWEIKRLEDIISIKHGFAFDGAFFTNIPNDWILLTPGNFHRDGQLYFGENTKYFTGDIPNEYVLENGDLLIVMTDLTKEMTILGNAIILYSTKRVLHNQRTGKIEIKIEYEKDISKEFVCTLLNSGYVKKWVKLTATGTTVRHSSPSKILDIEISLPNFKEQNKIVSILSSIDKSKEDYQCKLSKTKSLKKALMQDLLTGTVRVKV